MWQNVAKCENTFKHTTSLKVLRESCTLISAPSRLLSKTSLAAAQRPRWPWCWSCGRLVIAVRFDLAGHSSCFLTASLSFQMYGMELEAREQFWPVLFLKRFNSAFVVPQVTPTKVIWCSVYRSKHPTTFSIYSLYEPAIFGVQDVAQPPPMET